MELDPFTMLPAPPRNPPRLKGMFEFPDKAEQLGTPPLVEGTTLTMLNVAGNCIAVDDLKWIVDGMPLLETLDIIGGVRYTGMPR